MWSDLVVANESGNMIVSFRDSLVAGKKDRVLMNSVKITNRGLSEKNIYYRISLPRGWKNVAGGAEPFVGSHTVAANETKSIRINLLKLPSATAEWSNVTIIIWSDVGADSQYHYCHVRVEAIESFSGENLSQPINISTSQNPGRVTLKARLKNSGNIPDTYTLFWTNNLFRLNDEMTIRLVPGQDTVLSYDIVVKEAVWKSLSDERIYLSIKNGSKKLSQDLWFPLIKATNSTSEHASARMTIPVTLGGGIMSFGEDVSYFGTLSAAGKIGEHHQLDFNYRSKQIGSVLYQYLPNVVTLNYKYKDRVAVNAGTISGPRDFYVLGNGVGVSIRSKKEAEFNITAIKHLNLQFQNNRNDNISAQAKYRIGKINILQHAIYNHDLLYKIKSYILSNEINVLQRKDLRLSFMTGAGMDQLAIDATLPADRIGLAGGYSFSGSKAGFGFSSSVKYYSPDYPGLFKGSLIQLHELNKSIGSNTLGIFYSANKMGRVYYRDTLYNSDFLSYNNSKYGLRVAKNSKTVASSISGGIMKQTGQLSLINMESTWFTDVYVMWKSKGENSIALTSSNAFQDNLFITNTSIQLSSRHFGLNGFYNRTPRGNAEANKQVQYSETINGGPSVNFSLFNNLLNGGIRYNLSKSLSDDYVTSGVGGQLNYTDKHGLNISASGFYPLTQTSAFMPIANVRNFNVSISKRINMPVSGVKYSDLKLVLFEDKNGDGLKGDDETSLNEALVYIDGRKMITNKKGEVKFNNISAGNHKVDLVDARISGLIPTRGTLQTVEVFGNTTFHIPFKKGRVLSGNVSIELDSLSNTTMSPDYIKIMISDTMGNEYYALTNLEGDYYITLPSGVYSVALNPKAFQGSDFKADRMKYEADLERNEKEFIQFTIKQKKRKIRFLNENKQASGK